MSEGCHGAYRISDHKRTMTHRSVHLHTHIEHAKGAKCEKWNECYSQENSANTHIWIISSLTSRGEGGEQSRGAPGLRAACAVAVAGLVLTKFAVVREELNWRLKMRV